MVNPNQVWINRLVNLIRKEEQRIRGYKLYYSNTKCNKYAGTIKRVENSIDRKREALDFLKRYDIKMGWKEVCFKFGFRAYRLG